jgi:hypothetical protein
MTTRCFGAYVALAHRGVVVAALASGGCIPAALTLGSNDAELSDATVCVGDTCCDSGSPGACAAGQRMLDGGAAACVPLLSTQPCYTGEAGTNGVGACHGGTQSCVGSLGHCNGEVTPAPVENCFNAVDDDCDGVVNNGCPSLLSLINEHSPPAAGGDGGGPNSAHCPQGSFVTRVDSWGDSNPNNKHASGVSIWCATPTLVRGTTSYSVNLTRNLPAPSQQLVGLQNASDDRTDDCGLTGLTGLTSLTAITYTVGVADDFVEGLGHHCATSAVTLQPDNTMTFDFKGDGGTTYTRWGDGGVFFDQVCGPNEVVVGFVVRNGLWLNRIAPICAELSVVTM